MEGNLLMEKQCREGNSPILDEPSCWCMHAALG
jgi:hypothetical protein